MSDELGPELSSCFLQLLGIAQWAIELGCINIHHKVSLLSQYQANPRVGHLEALYHVFAYTTSHLDIGCVVFDPKTPVFDESAFNSGSDWKEFYGARGSRGIATKDSKATGTKGNYFCFC
jgi:hypothetical protein